jgi:hypothetical protein
MAKATRYTLEQVQVAQKKLRSLAEKTSGKTRAETVEFLAPDIRRAVHQGYSLKEIQDLLGKAGISAPMVRMKALLDETDEEASQKSEAGSPASMDTVTPTAFPYLEKRRTASPDTTGKGEA